MIQSILEIPYDEAADVFASVQRLPYALLLDSADRAHPDARYSFICAHPIETIEAKNGRITVSDAKGQTTYEGDPFAVLNDRIAAHNMTQETRPDLPPFQGGAAGFFGYDLGRAIEPLPSVAKDNPNMLDMAVGIYDQIMAFDHQEKRAWIITHADHEARAQQKQKMIFDIINRHPEAKPKDLKTQSEILRFAQNDKNNLIKWTSNFTKDTYQDAVHKVINHIRAGDIFQANIAQRFDAKLPQGFDPYGHYRNMRAQNPAPFAGFMNLNEIKISSASPERFLRVKNNIVETRPIKGTAPRSSNKKQDKKNREALETSEKDRAENIMIVDLLRNDLSKVCEARSITVTDLCKLESFARVHHLVSTVTGTLNAGQNAIDLLRACFPGGSITGAPKIRAMEIIEELEPIRRGPYCGAMGYIGFNGAMDTNILIRTLIYDGDTISLSVGGGITTGSNPAAEYQETLDKADAVFGSFETENTEVKAL